MIQWQAWQGIAGSSDTPASQYARALRIHGLHQFANRPVEIHAVTAQTIVHQPPLRVMPGIGKDLRVAGAMRTRMPTGVLVLVALLHLGVIASTSLPQPDRLRPAAGKMYGDGAAAWFQAGLVALHAGPGAVMRAVHRGHIRCHLMAARASWPRSEV